MSLITRTRTIEFMLFLSGYFLYRFQYGLENEFVSFNLAPLQILCAIYALLRFPIKPIALLLVVGGALALLLVQGLYYYGVVIPESSLPGDGYEYLSAALRLWVYLFFICAYALTVRQQDLDDICNAFLKLSRFSVIVALLSLVLYHVTGISVLLNFYAVEHLIRPQAFLSEPSAFAPIAAVLLIVGWTRGTYKDIGYALLALAVTFSPISIMTTVGTAFLYAFLFGIRSVLLKATIACLGLAVIVPMLTMDCVPLVTSLNGFERTLGRMSCGVQVIFDNDLRDQLKYTFTNQRLTSAFISIDHLQQYEGVFFGFGLNSSSVFMPELYGVVRENSLWFSMLLFYGVVGLLVFFLVVLAALFWARNVPRDFAVLFLSLVVASTLNSAGGFYLYSLVFFVSGVLLVGRIR